MYFSWSVYILYLSTMSRSQVDSNKRRNQTIRSVCKPTFIVYKGSWFDPELSKQSLKLVILNSIHSEK